MCGIIAEFNTQTKKTKDANEFIINQYQDQVRRGNEGYGIINMDSKGKIEIKRATTETKFLLDLMMGKSKNIIAHHRKPTSTENLINQTHPMEISHKSFKHDYMIIHNGIVLKTTELHDKHTKLGFTYKTEYVKNYTIYNSTVKFNDTESLAIELALFLEDKQQIIEIDNPAAFIIVQIDKKTKKAIKVIFGKTKTSSALNMFKTKGNLKISSEGVGDEVESEIFHSFKIGDPKMKITKDKVTFQEIGKEEKDKKEAEEKALKIEKERENFINKSTQSLLPYPMGEDDIRDWCLDKGSAEENYLSHAENIEEVDNKYPERILTDFKNFIESNDSQQTLLDIESAIDTQIDIANNILIDFKEFEMTYKGGKRTSLYISRMVYVLKAMEKIIECGEENYEKRWQEESEEAAIEDIAMGYSYKKKPYTSDIY